MSTRIPTRDKAERAGSPLTRGIRRGIERCATSLPEYRPAPSDEQESAALLATAIQHLDWPERGVEILGELVAIGVCTRRVHGTIEPILTASVIEELIGILEKILNSHVCRR